MKYRQNVCKENYAHSVFAVFCSWIVLASADINHLLFILQCHHLKPQETYRPLNPPKPVSVCPGTMLPVMYEGTKSPSIPAEMILI